VTEEKEKGLRRPQGCAFCNLFFLQSKSFLLFASFKKEKPDAATTSAGSVYEKIYFPVLRPACLDWPLLKLLLRSGGSVSVVRRKYTPPDPESGKEFYSVGLQSDE